LLSRRDNSGNHGIKWDKKGKFGGTIGLEELVELEISQKEIIEFYKKEGNIEKLPELLRQIVNSLGIETALKVLEILAGEKVYFPKLDSVLNSIRDMMIKQEFEGSNYKELALKYNLSTRKIREIIKEDIEPLLIDPRLLEEKEMLIDTNCSLFDRLKDKVKLEELPEQYQLIAHEFDIETALKVAKTFGGQQVLFSNLNNVTMKYRNLDIKRRFNGSNIKELAREYNLSAIRIRQIVKGSA